MHCISLKKGQKLVWHEHTDLKLGGWPSRLVHTLSGWLVTVCRTENVRGDCEVQRRPFFVCVRDVFGLFLFRLHVPVSGFMRNWKLSPGYAGICDWIAKRSVVRHSCKVMEV